MKVYHRSNLNAYPLLPLHVLLNWLTIGLDNGLLLVQHLAIILTNADFPSISLQEAYINVAMTKIKKYSENKFFLNYDLYFHHDYSQGKKEFNWKVHPAYLLHGWAMGVMVCTWRTFSALLGIGL